MDAARTAAASLAAGDEPVAGGHGLRAGAVPLILTGAVWGPDPARLDEVAAFAASEGLIPAVLTHAGDPAEAALAAAGWSPVTGVALDSAAVPATADASDAAGATDRDVATPLDGAPTAAEAHGPDGAPVGWDGAAEVAAVLASAYAEEAVEADAGDAHEDVVAALATLLASAVAENERVRLELGGPEAEGARAAMVVHEDDDAAVVVLSGGPADRMVRSALATARGLGKAAWRLRETAADADDVVLRRWEPAS